MIETQKPLGHGEKACGPGRRDMEKLGCLTERLRRSPQTNKRLLVAVSQRLEKLATSPDSPRRCVARRNVLHPLSQGESRSETRSPSPAHSPRLRIGSFGSDHRGSRSYDRSPGHRHGSDLDLRLSPSASNIPGSPTSRHLSPGNRSPGNHSPGHKHGSDHDLRDLRSPVRSPRHRHRRHLERRHHGGRLVLLGAPTLKRIDELRRGSLTGSLPDLREAGTLDHLEMVFREAVKGHPVAPVPPLPQGSDIFQEAMRDLRPDDSEQKDDTTAVQEKKDCQLGAGITPVSRHTSKHGWRRLGTIPSIVTHSTPTSPRHRKRLPSPPKSTPASPGRPAGSTSAFPRFHGGQLLSPMQIDRHRHRHKSDEN